MRIISNFQFLSDFRFSLKQSQHLTNEGMISIAKALSMKPFINTLSLSFEMCINFSDFGFHHLIAIISSIPKLLSLSLCFSYCANLSRQALWDSRFSLKDMLKRLKFLSIKFSKTSLLYNKYISKLYQMLSEQYSLERDLVFE